MKMVLDYLTSVHPMSDECYNHLATIIKTRHVSKKGFLLRPGEVCTDIHVVVKGLVRCYYLEGETEVTAWLRKEKDVIVSVDSYYDQAQSYEYIQAVEDCELAYISFKEEKEVFDTYPEFNVIGRLLTQKELRDHARELRNIRMLTAAQRYQHFLERYPELVQRVPLMYLASYLNMKPETLSRMRAQAH